MGGVCNNTKFQLFQTMFAKLPFHVIRLLYSIWTMYKLNFFLSCVNYSTWAMNGTFYTSVKLFSNRPIVPQWK